MASWITERAPALAVVTISVLLLGVMVTTCRAPEARTLPPPSSTAATEPTTTTSEPDFSLVALPAVTGETTTTAPMGEGSATLQGVVQGPDGVVPDAVVRAERLVGEAVQRLDTRTGPDGTFSLAGVPGGRYRVRAFLPPSLAMNEPEIFFHPDGETRDLRLVVEEFGGVVISSDTSPRSPIVGNGVNLAVRVAERRVDDDGVVREVPVPGVAVRVDATGWARATAAAPSVTTGPDGIAVFDYRCERATSVTATAIVNVGGTDERFPLDVPECSPVPTTTTTTTTTTEPDGSTTSTSTTTTP